MGAGLALTEIAHVITHENTYDAANRILTRVSLFSFGLDTMPRRPTAAEKKTEADFGPADSPAGAPTGRIAIRLANGLTIPTGEFRLLSEGVTYTLQEAESGAAPGNVRKDAEDTFGRLAGHAWHGYTVDLPPTFNRPEMHALLKVKGILPGRGASVAYLALGFFFQSFAVHHALALSLLQDDTAYILDTSVRKGQ